MVWPGIERKTRPYRWTAAGFYPFRSVHPGWHQGRAASSAASVNYDGAAGHSFGVLA